MFDLFQHRLAHSDIMLAGALVLPISDCPSSLFVPVLCSFILSFLFLFSGAADLNKASMLGHK